MKKTVAAQVSLVAFAVASGAFADGPPAGGSLRVSFDGHAGSATSFTGGNVVTPTSPTGAAGAPALVPLRLTLSTSAPSGLYTFIGQQISGAAGSHTLVLSSVSSTGKSIGGLQMQDPTMGELSLPALDHADNSEASLVVSLSAAPSSVKTGSPEIAAPEARLAPRWLKSNFTANVAGVSGAITAVSAIQFVGAVNSGGLGARLRVMPFHMTFPPSAQAGLQTWTTSAKSGSPGNDAIVVYQGVSPKGETKTDLFTVSLAGCNPSTSTMSGVNYDVVVSCTRASLKTTAGF